MLKLVREVDLIQYLPLFIAEYKEMKHIMETENPEFQYVVEEAERIKNNQFIITCDLVGIARFEKLLNITPSPEDTLQSRISRVLIRWNEMIPYTWKIFLQKLTAICGDNYTVNPDWNHYILEIIVHLDLYGQMDELEKILDFMLPANIEVIVKNILDYTMNGNAYVVVGMVVCDVFELTDSFKVTWSLNADAGASVIGSGTCEVELTDSFQGVVFGSEIKAGSLTSQQFTENIVLSDTFSETIQIDSSGNTGSSISFTEII